MCSFCPLCAGKCLTLVRTYNTVKKIVRWLAVGDAVAGFCILVFMITNRWLTVDLSNISEDQKAAEIVKLVILCLFGFQLLFSLILHEGARREILCMIKAWLVYCLMKLVIQTVGLTRYLTDSWDSKSRGIIDWMKFINVVATLYGFLEAVLILIFHHHMQTEQSPLADEKDPVDAENSENLQNEERLDAMQLTSINPIVPNNVNSNEVA